MSDQGRTGEPASAMPSRAERQPIVFLYDGVAQCMACENTCDMNADLAAIEADEIKRLRADNADLLAALKGALRKLEGIDEPAWSGMGGDESLDFIRAALARADRSEQRSA